LEAYALKKLCFSSLAKILVLCKATAATQLAIGEVLLLSVAPSYESTITDDRVSAFVGGRDNLPTDVSNGALSVVKANTQRSLSSQLKAKLLLLLDNNKKALIALALKDLLASDADIQNDTVVELVNGMTKAAVLARDSFVFEELIAGVFLYVAIYAINRGTQSNVKEITDEYINAFEIDRTNVSFISAYATLDNKELREIAIDTHTLVLLAENEGHCLSCGKPLGSTVNGRDVNYSSIIRISDTEEILLCAECARQYASMTPEEKSEIVHKKRKLAAQAAAREATSHPDLDMRINAVIREINGLEVSDQTRLRDEPLRVEEKISEQRLLRHVLDDVQEQYNGVRESMLRASGENRLNIDVFERNVRRIYEDIRDKYSTQREIYDFMVNKLFEMSGRKYRVACEVLVSCFVQRCEVLDEIAK
jgi:hypothetical protein